MSDATQDTKILLGMALQLGQFQSGFLKQIAHELRSPMSQMMSLQQLILADLCEDPAEEREFIAQCYESSKQFMTLLDLAIDVSNLDYGTSFIKADNFNFLEIATEIEAIFEIKARDRNLQFHVAPPETKTGVMMVGDRQRTQQLLVMLLDTTINQSTAKDIFFSYSTADEQRLNFQIRSEDNLDFWEQTATKNLAIEGKPTIADLQKMAYDFEFSPSLKWQLCEKIATGLGGNLSRKVELQESAKLIQVEGWLPLASKK
ncbi:MAG: histidine kinase dimerization/phospho-acceptor domain-containing protein [Limnothrix sp.]